MKIQNISHLLIFISIFGLCSCNSDKGKEITLTQEDSWSIQSARFVHPDKSSTDVNDTLDIQPLSKIKIFFKGEPAKEITYKIDSTCYSDQTPYPESMRFEDISETQMTAAHLLPVAMYKPRSENERVQCNFNIIARNSNNSKQQYELKNLKITNFSTYSNHNPLGFEDLSKTHFLYTESISEKLIDIPEDSHQVHLLCEKNYVSLQAKNDLTFGELLNPIKNRMQALQLCRIVSSNQSQTKKFVSPIFWLQKNMEKVIVDTKVNLPNKHNIDTNENPVITLTLSNTNDHPVFINFTEDISRIAVQPILHLQNRQKAWFMRNFSAKINWVFEESNVIETIGKWTRMKINAHSSTTVKGHANLVLHCPADIVTAPVNANVNHCSSKIVLWGYTYDFTQMAQINQSQISRYDSKSWVNVFDGNLAYKDKAYHGHSLWAPTDFPGKCSQFAKNESYPLVSLYSSGTGIYCQQEQ